MKLHERIKKCRLDRGMTLLEVANALGVREATAQRYESGEIKNLKQATVLEMARIFNCSPAYLMGWEEFSESRANSEKLPLLGKIAAGQPILATEDCEYFSPINDTRADFCLRVKGDSMIGAGIKDGDIVFIRKQDSVDDGESFTAPVPVIDTCLDDRDVGLCKFGENGVIVTSFNNTRRMQRRHNEDNPPVMKAYINS